MSKDATPRSDLGGNFFDRLESAGLNLHCIKRLEALGHNVTLDSAVPT
ncbi:MAG: hypothetical protein ABSF71_19155 [Terriglobia bacterium]